MENLAGRLTGAYVLPVRDVNQSEQKSVVDRQIKIWYASATRKQDSVSHAVLDQIFILISRHRFIFCS